MKTLTAIFAATLAVALATPAAAQARRTPQPKGPTRFYVSLNGGVQPANADLSDHFEFPSNAETATVDVKYPKKAGVLIDGGGGVQLWRQLGAGVAVSYVSSDGTAAIEASIPHPFLFGQPRQISGEQGSVARTETSAHVQLLYFVPTRGKLHAIVSGGPSFVSLSQDVVTDVDFSEVYPYDTAAFTRATTKAVKGNAVGFNIGVDLRWMFSREFGVGGLVRFTRATVDLDVAEGRSFSVDTGGVQAGGGVRIFF